MKFYMTYFVAGLMACIAFGCNKPASDKPASGTSVSDNSNVQAEDSEIAARRAAREEKVRAQAEKLRKEGRMLAPRVDIQFNVTQTNERISFDDAMRSWEYKKGTMSRCYKEVLMFNEAAKGTISVKLSRGTDAKILVSNFSTTMNDPDFDDCVKQVFATWRLPEQAEIEAHLTLSARPAPTPEEIRQIYGTGGNSVGHHNHDHGHAGHQH